MKNSNLLNRLLSYSHEKQSPQRFARYAAMLIMLLTLGVGQMWADKVKYVFFNPNQWNSAGAWYAVRYRNSSNDAIYWTGTEQVPNTGIYYSTVPSGGYDKFELCRMASGQSLSGDDATNRSHVWNWSGEKDLPDEGTMAAYIGYSGSNYTAAWLGDSGHDSDVGKFYYIEAGTTVYFDNTDAGFSSVHMRLGRHGLDSYGNSDKDDVYRHTNDYTMSLVPGTNALYKYTFASAWIGYEAFSFGNNVGATGGYSVYNMSTGDYLISKSTEFFRTNLNASAYTVIGSNSWIKKENYTDFYYIASSSRSRLTYTITNTAVEHATVELYYWDESNVRRTVAEGASAEVLPTTKVWCRVNPDEGYAVPKVMISDPSEREWTDASNESSGRNLYIVRKDVTFRAVVEPRATKTILIKDVNSWAPNMYFKGWNPFQYSGYDNEDYYITTQKISTVDKVHLCDADYYAVTFTNEFPFYYIHPEGGTPRTAFFTYSKLTHMNKYDNTQAGDGNWGLVATGCSDAIYWVETKKGTTHYISNVVGNTSDTLSFYAAVGSTVEFHVGGDDPVDVYSSVIAPYFGTGRELYGKAGAVFTARTNGSGLTDVAIFDGDYEIHVNATTTNYLLHGESRSGAAGKKFTKFETNPLFDDVYDHYWVDWFLGSGDAGSYEEQSVVATVGNKYNANLAGVLGSDEYAPKGMTKSTGGNVRYGYNPETNYFKRAIIDAGNSAVRISSSVAGKVMISTNGGSTYTQDASSTTCYFADATNWNYQVFAKIKGKSTATASTSYVTGTQKMAENKQLIGGDTGEDYVVVITYDFKTNRFIAAWKPVAPFEGFDLQSNLMVVRTEDGNPTVLNIVDQNGDSKVNPLSSISKVYTVLELLQDNWNSTASPYSSRPYAKRRVVSGGYTDEYYWISLPYDCLVKDIFGIEGYGNGDRNEDSWVLQTYRGDLRAEKGWWAETNAWWYDMDRGDTLKANEGYVLRVTNLNGDGVGTKRFAGVSGGKLYLYFPSHASDTTIGPLASTVTTHLDSLKCTKWHKRPKDVDETEGANNPIYDRRAVDSNWRIIGSPSFNSTKISAPTFENIDMDANDNGIVTYEEYKNAVDQYIKDHPGASPYSLKYFYNWEVESDGISRYETKFTIADAATQEFVGTHAHLVQYAGDITWTAYDASNPLVGLVPNIKSAPARKNDDDAMPMEQTLRLVLQQGTREADVAYISRMAFGATMGYDLNMDLSKMINANSANIYTMGELYKMAGNCIPDTVTVLPVGVQLTADGAYTFAIPDGTYGTGVVLIDKVADTRTNLALTDYTVNLTAGTYDERFEIELSPIAQTPTDIETISDERLEISGVRKVMVDGILYIVKDGKVFDAQGNRVK